MKHSNAALLLFSCLLLVSCDPSMVYDHYEATDGGQWKWQDKKEFRVEIGDTVSMHNIYVQVRHSVDYPLSNLYMFVSVVGPSGRHLKDTVNLVLAEPDGKWIGSGLGKFREIRLLYRKQTRFGEPGTYTFILEQAMRKQELPVADLGIRIERTNTD